jgi:hypothetical protein
MNKCKFLIVTKESLSTFYHQNVVDHNIKTANKSLKQGGSANIWNNKTKAKLHAWRNLKQMKFKESFQV